MKPKAFQWLDKEAKQFLGFRRNLVYFTCFHFLVTCGCALVTNYKAHLKLYALDRAVGAVLDNTFLGPALNTVVNYSLNTPGVTDKYSSMQGIGLPVILAALCAFSCIILSIWIYLLLTTDSGSKQLDSAAATS